MPINGYSKHDDKTLETIKRNRKAMQTDKGNLNYEFAFIDLIAKCHYSCEGCFNQELNSTGASLSWNELTYIVDFLKSRGGRTITFAGSGEPLLDPLMLPLIEYAKRQGIDSVLFSTLTTETQTGLVPIASDLAQKLNELNAWIIAKRNALYNDKQDAILKREGAGEMMYAGLQRIIDAGFSEKNRLLMDCPIDRHTIDEVPTLLRYCRERNILPYFESYINLGQDKSTRDAHKISSLELTDLFFQLQKIDREFGIETPLKPNMRIYAADACKKPEYGFAVKANGDVRTCPTNKRTTIGNIKEEPLTMILSTRNDRYKRLFGKYGCCVVLKNLQ